MVKLVRIIFVENDDGDCFILGTLFDRETGICWEDVEKLSIICALLLNNILISLLIQVHQLFVSGVYAWNGTVILHWI